MLPTAGVDQVARSLRDEWILRDNSLADCLFHLRHARFQLGVEQRVDAQVTEGAIAHNVNVLPQENVCIGDQLEEWRASVQHPYMRVRGVMAARPVRIREEESVLRADEILALSGASDLMVVTAAGMFVGVLSAQLVWHELCRPAPRIAAEAGARIIDRLRAE